MGKSTNHKKENTFRFQTFSERIAQINIDVIHQIRHHDDTPEETSTYFGEALEKQSELNCTDHFTTFRREIADQVRTFAQLVHHEEEIVAALKKHLLVPKSMAVTALLDLVVQLARDLQIDFYRHFPDFFNILVQLLSWYTQDTEVLEKTFTCLSYIFKFLWRYMVKDIQQVYGYFSSLLGTQYKEHVRNFAAESFAFLMRKVKDHSALFDFLFMSLKDEPDKTEGLGRLLFEMVKGVKEQFHSCITKVFPIVLEKLSPKQKQSTNALPWDLVEEALSSTMVTMTTYSNREKMEEVWDILRTSVMESYNSWQSSSVKKQKQSAADGLERLLRLIKITVDHRNGHVITKPDELAKALLELLRGPSLPVPVGEALISLVSSLLTTSHARLEVQNSAKVIAAVFQTDYPVSCIYDFTRTLFPLPLFEKDVLPSLLKYCQSHITMDTESCDLTVLLVTQMLIHKCPVLQDGGHLDSMDTFMLDFGTGKSAAVLPDYVLSLLNTDGKSDHQTYTRMWAGLVCLPHVRPLDQQAAKDRVASLMKDLMSSCNDDPSVNNCAEFVVCQALVTMVMMGEEQEELFSLVPVEKVKDYLLKSPSSVHVLRMVDVYLTYAQNLGASDIRSSDLFMTVFPVLQPNLSSHHRMVRLLTLRIFSSFDLPLPSVSDEYEVEDVFKICLSVEMTPPTVQDYRDKKRHLQKLEYTSVQNSLPAGPLTQVPLRYLLGTLYINFTLLWEPVRKLIASHAHGLDKQTFWEVYKPHLVLAQEHAEALTNGDTPSPVLEETVEEDSLTDVFSNCVLWLSQDSSIPDHVNFRDQLWKAMQEFPDKCEPKSREFVPLFFSFLKNEYYLTDLSVAPTQNILKKSDSSELTSDITKETSDSEEEDLSPRRPRTRKSSVNVENKAKEDISEERTVKRPRTRRRCGMSSESDTDHNVPVSGRVRTRSQTVSESESVSSPPRRLRTRSRGESECETKVDNDKSGDVVKNSDKSVSRRIRTRSHTSDTEDIMEVDESGEKDTDNGRAKDSTKPGKRKRLSLISELDEGKVVPETGGKAKDAEAQDGGAGGKKKRKAATSSLLVHLGLFAKFRDPRSIYMEPQLRSLYLDLLVHKSLEVQKMAFACIMTYKYKYLTPYRENFERLLDDKTFKNEIVLFSIDNENSAVSVDHRPDTLPILMRILYGKMQVKTGKGTAGKQYSHVRQSIVFRFLNGCERDEIKMFIDLVLAPFHQFTTGDIHTMVQGLKNKTDLSKILPVKKMQGTLNSLDTILKKLGHMLDSVLPTLIQLIVGIATVCGVCLANREKIAPYVISPLKSIRQQTLIRLIQIFEEYDKYEWRVTELDAVFDAMVWPQLDKLSYEGLYSPTPLLKLLNCWTKYPRYYSLLGKHHETDPSLTPLTHVIKLLLNKDVSTKVSTYIMNMVSQLLKPQEEEEGVKVIHVSHMTNLPSADNIEADDLGTRLLLPHIPDILVHIQNTVGRLQKLINQKQETYTELRILSRLSSFVKDEAACSTLIHLLLPFLHKKVSKSQATEEDILSSIHHLLQQLSDPAPFHAAISSLFATLYHRNSRTLLCDAFWVVCEKDETLRKLAAIVRQLNSWDRRRMDEPDYMLRLEGYKAANDLLQGSEVMDPRVCLGLIHNCCFFISTVEDMSLRDSSTHCLVTMVTRLGEVSCSKEVFSEVISNGLLPEIRQGLRSKNETVRHEFITLLVSVIDTFKDQSRFDELRELKDADIEADFYENIKHIQMHKRSRALRRLIKHLLSKQVSNNTILVYFLPIVSAFITDERYKKYSAVQDAAVDAIGVVCQQLQWKHYLYQLKYYLKMLGKKLDSQKLYVRVIVSVLDGFHFDLSNSTLNMKLIPKVATEESSGKEDPVQKTEDKQGDKAEEKTDGDDVDVNEEEPVPEINEAQGDGEPVEIVKGKQLCPEPLATKIHGVILKSVVAQLHKILVAKIKSEEEHKLARSNFAEDNEILRVPIALAMVKLLQTLPKGALQKFLPGILLKVCNFLRSRSNDIRNTSRDTLVKIQSSLGPRYFPFILSELRGSLKRGYQRHVLCFTVHTLLKNMEETVQPGDIDVCLKSLQEVSNEEIFGEQSEEKEVEGVLSKVFEARSSKSYDSYELMARYISKGSLMALIEPLKQILDTTHSHKSARKVQEVLKKIVHGLMVNKNVDVEVLLVFIHGLTTQTLPLLQDKQEPKEQKEQKERPGQRPESCLLLQKEAPRGGMKPKASKKTNIHVLVEFGLQLLSQCLKRQKVTSTDQTHLQMLDPLVPMLADCLFSKYIRVNATALRVLCTILRFKLPSLEVNIQQLANGMFILLRNYAAAGAAKGDNLELVSMLFKAVTVLVKDVQYYTVSPDQLKVLMTFCEEDLHDNSRQSTAFSLLKAVLSRKLDVPEIQDLMTKVREMAITADSAHVQRECRQVTLQYLLDYPLKKKLKNYLEFFVSQLSYELEHGRESALEMLASFFTSFPQKLLAEHSGLFFVPMAANLVNDESAKCRKLTGLALKKLLGNLDHNQRSQLFTIAIKWFMDTKLRHRTLASQLCGLFVEVEGARFESRLSTILPVLEQQLEPGRYEKAEQHSQEHDQDHLLYNTLHTLLKVTRECPQILTDQEWDTNMKVIWEHVQSHVIYPHVWVQLTTAQLFGLLFAAWKPEQLVTMETSKQCVVIDTPDKLKSLASDFVTQLQSELLNEEVANQVTKNLIYLSRCARLLDGQVGEEPSGGQEEGQRFSVVWLVRKMVREAHHEALYNNKVSIKRLHVFKWMAGLSLDLGEAMSPGILRTLIGPLQREMADQSITHDPALKSLAQEVIEMLKKQVGVEKFTKVYASTQKARAERKDERQRNRALQAVANPEQAAKRKMKKNIAKKEAKKRKVEMMRPSKKTKKRKYQEFALTD